VQLDRTAAHVHNAHGCTVGVVSDGNACATYHLRVVRALALVLLVASLAASAAYAKDGVQFDRAAAHVGDRLVLSSSWNAHPRGLVAYFMSLQTAARWYRTSYTGDVMPNNGPPPRGVRGVIRLGALKANGRAVRLAFVVPRVAPGRYVLGIWCKPCNAHWTTALPNWQPNPNGILTVRP
jgi:hypothetical protein